MLKKDYLGRIELYQNDFSDSLNSVFAVHYEGKRSFIPRLLKRLLS